MTTQATTKLVEIRLSAMTRVEYIEVAQVPADISDAELQALVNKRYADVDGGMYFDDPEYWERGSCYVTPAEMSDAVPEYQVLRAPDGLDIRELEPSEGEPTDAGLPVVAADPVCPAHDELVIQLRNCLGVVERQFGYPHGSRPASYASNVAWMLDLFQPFLTRVGQMEIEASDANAAAFIAGT